MREIIFDTETTGFDPKSGDRMVEIGCIEMVNRVPTGQSYHAYFNPERGMPAEAEAVHGLSDAFLSDKPLFAQCAEEFLAFIEDSPMIAHNAAFDFNFINAELALCGHPEVSRARMVDTVALAKVRHPGAKLSLDALCTRYGIDRSHRTKHGALLDAELLAQVYVELRGGRQIGLELVAETADIVSEARILVRKDRPFRQPRPHAATEEELSIHAEFLKSVDAPLWGA
ncbi:DNA polymerase III subunit epsilon [Novosphingobium aerophilum]|uniref:DNA polymerase III subunit epsilon n=1 Tax=Novosphingobium TaxID=165696 RepID=UPI0006C8CF5C|nr:MULTISPECIES: DNA polymerase III subunit epsilon [unclassified Novosphingobium]KPH57451.1 DNA polymerase III subunit epsilon [Novosphingobium sp. ST904]TCM42992.1 DNA polymerase-3 subunit epsilon [Novosphingobium sp. ST904]WRT93275.1 DNA polymerase III subunit epsilon [Novosphingobium sp. RL4]